jgi:sugar-specific transcriptional regulator TrmB
MAEDFQSELQELGLLPAEAQVYLALVRNGALGGSAIASVTGFPRSSVYLTLNSLLDKGLIESGAGHGSRFSVVPPDKALPSLVTQEKEAIVQREKLALQLGHKLTDLVEPTEDARPDELIQVIRNPRAVAERFERLRLETKRTHEIFCKPPIFVQAASPVVPDILRRGVRVRALYEAGLLEIPAIRQDVALWIAQGEEVRVYDGELPHKLAIFDRKKVLAHLRMSGDQMRTIYIEHPELAASLGITFDTLWKESQPVAVADGKKARSDAIRVRRRNAHASQARKIEGQV